MATVLLGQLGSGMVLDIFFSLRNVGYDPSYTKGQLTHGSLRLFPPGGGWLQVKNVISYVKKKCIPIKNLHLCQGNTYPTAGYRTLH